MSEPKRLLAGTDLLRAARRERPSGRARTRTMRAAVRVAPRELTAWKAVVMGLVALGATIAGVSMTHTVEQSPPVGVHDELPALVIHAPAMTSS